MVHSPCERTYYPTVASSRFVCRQATGGVLGEGVEREEPEKGGMEGQKPRVHLSLLTPLFAL